MNRRLLEKCAGFYFHSFLFLFVIVVKLNINGFETTLDNILEDI